MRGSTPAILGVLCFVIAAGFLLSLVPDPRKKAAIPADPAVAFPETTTRKADIPAADASARVQADPAVRFASAGPGDQVGPLRHLMLEPADVRVLRRQFDGLR